MAISPELTGFLSNLKVQSGPAFSQGDHPQHLDAAYYTNYQQQKIAVWDAVIALGLDQQGMKSTDYLAIIKYAASEGWPGAEEAMQRKKEGYSLFVADVYTANSALQWLADQQEGN